MLRLEDERVLRDPAPPVSEPPPVEPARPGQKPAAVVAAAPPPVVPDLVRLLGDGEARVRRRAALAVGRVGLREGVAPLVKVLADPDPEVRQMAAFALGLIGDRSARDALIAALGDPEPVVKGSAAEALGLIGDPAAADPIARMATQVVDAGALAQVAANGADADEDVRDTPAAAFRLGIFALVRLKAYPALASAVLDASGQPRVHWWPVAYALQRIDDPRAFAALAALVKDEHPYTRAFAAKGLGGLKNRAAVPLLVPLVAAPERAVAVEAIRALGRIGDPAGAAPLLAVIQARTPPKGDPTLRIEAVAAIGGVGGGANGVFDTLLDLLGDPNPLVRAAAIASLAQVDRDGFVTTLSALDPDADWKVRAALASVLGTLPPQAGLARLRAMLADADQRVIPPVLESLAKLAPPDAGVVMIAYLKADDPMVRAAAADALGELKPADAAQALADAYALGQRDPEYAARVSAISALAKFGTAAATPVLTTALADREWAVRLRAAALLKAIDPGSDAESRIRPAPAASGMDFYQTAHLVDPPVSTSAYIDTDRGSIQIELAVLDAPITVESFVTLARKNFFEGLSFHRVVPDFVVQAGDPRGDGAGGPGFTIRDELNERPYLRGTVGMALDGADTGGSQFFITHSPQPHLDAKYTVFGRVVDGMDVVDALQPGDVIRQVRIWNGPP
jgi:HEAT repeat protein/cyclophilin family peptidyl-prolyl cis-trans isomerase